MFASLLLTVSLAALGSALPHDKRAKAQVVTKCSVPNTVALTFDDGPYHYTKNVSDTLKDAGAVGTFFFNGQNYACIYNEEGVEGIKYAYAQGHQIASHTWSHAHLSKLNRDQLNNEFWLVEQALKKIAGVVPAFMRPPYGDYNDLVLEVAGDRGQKVVIWDFDSGDSTGSSVAESKKKYDDVVRNHPNTLLALNHEVYETTAHQVLPYAIKVLKDAGYRLVSLADCLGVPAYQSVGSAGTRDGSWKC